MSHTVNLSDLQSQLGRKDIYHYTHAAELSENFEVFYLSKEKQPVKVYNKSIYLNTEIGDSDDLALNLEWKKKYTLPFFKKLDSYKFLPNLVFETDTYFGTTWYSDDEWRLASKDDFITKIPFIDTPSAPHHYVITNMFKDVIKSFKELHANEKVNLTEEEAVFWKTALVAACSGHDRNLDIPLSDVDELYYPGITVKNVSYADIVVKEADSEIIDWKYVDLENFHCFASPYYNYLLEFGDNDWPTPIPSPTMVNFYDGNMWLSKDLDTIL
jgi:hypothetical protein